MSHSLLPALMWFSFHLPDVWLSLSQALIFFNKEIVSYVAVDTNEFRIFLHPHLERFFNFYNFCIFSSVYFLIYSSSYTFIYYLSEFHFPREQDSSLYLHDDRKCLFKITCTQSLFSVCPISWYCAFLPVGYHLLSCEFSSMLWFP